MSRYKNTYQGISLGRVQRSEYDDAKLRDLARIDARLGESLKTVDRARNVMKKSMEADKHMLIKTGLQMARKVPVTSHGAHSHPDSKTALQQPKTASDLRVKRFSVSEMPSDLDRTRQYRKKSVSRPPSYHEQITQSPISKEYSYSHDKLYESRMLGNQAEEKKHQADGAAVFASSERLRGSEPLLSSDLHQQGVDSTARATTHAGHVNKYGKSTHKSDIGKLIDSTIRQTEAAAASASDSNARKSDDQGTPNDENTKDKSCEQSEVKDQDLKPRKKTPIWETLSTPKHTSMTKSKRNQIEQEFTTSRLTSYKSSPALFSTPKIKSPAFPGQGKPPLPENASSQGRKGEELKAKPAAPIRARVD